MPKRGKPVSEEKAADEAEPGAEQVQEPPAEGRRTRSGRTFRTPAPVLGSEAPVRTPSRRSRRSVLQELPVEVEETNTEEKPVSPAEDRSSMPAEPEPCPGAEQPTPEPAEPQTVTPAADTENKSTVNGSGDAPLSRPVPAEPVPKKPHLAPSEKPRPAIPLGKPKSGRVWKDRSKAR